MIGWIAIGFLLGLTFSCWADKPKMERCKRFGYRSAVKDMTEWNLYVTETGGYQFVNVIPIYITDPVPRAGDRRGVAWNDVTNTYP